MLCGFVMVSRLHFAQHLKYVSGGYLTNRTMANGVEGEAQEPFHFPYGSLGSKFAGELGDIFRGDRVKGAERRLLLLQFGRLLGLGGVDPRRQLTLGLFANVASHFDGHRRIGADG